MWRDPWTALLTLGITTGPPTQLTENWRVTDLLIDNKPAWDITKVQTLFPKIWKAILLIKPSASDAEDKYVWNPKADGEYTIGWNTYGSEEE